MTQFKRPIFSFDDEAKMIMDLIETKKYTEKELMALEGDQLVEIYVREGFTSPKAIPQVDETIEMKKDNSTKNDVFVNCRSCKQIITNDYRSTFDKRYCSDCL